MTLNVLFTSRHAVHLSGDFRITYPKVGFRDDLNTQKMIPTTKFGWVGMLSFCGRAELPDRTPVGMWLASEVDPESMRLSRHDLLARIRDGANKWISRTFGYKELSIVFAGFSGKSPFAHLLSNFQDQNGRRFDKVSSQLMRFDIDAKSAQVLCYGDTTSISAERRLALARSLNTSNMDLARERISAFNVDCWGASNGLGTVSRECVVGTAMPTGGGKIEPFHLEPGKQYLPQFVVNEFAAMGQELRPKLDSEGHELPIIWKGMAIGTSGEPKKGRVVIAHQFDNNQVELMQAEHQSAVPYNRATFAWVAQESGKMKVSSHHGKGNQLHGISFEYISKESSEGNPSDSPSPSP